MSMIVHQFVAVMLRGFSKFNISFELKVSGDKQLATSEKSTLWI